MKTVIEVRTVIDGCGLTCKDFVPEEGLRLLNGNKVGGKTFRCANYDRCQMLLEYIERSGYDKRRGKDQQED